MGPDMPLPPAASLLPVLLAQAPDIDPQALYAALDRVRCGAARGELPPAGPPSLAVVDFGLPSAAPRLWLFDLQEMELVLQTQVSHGKGTGEDLAQVFSNTVDSFQTSLGLYRGAEVYQGAHGLSLRLDGLDPGWNDHARERDIVVHGADYARMSHVEEFGRLGRSLGCPAVNPEVAPVLIEALAEGGALYAWYPDPDLVRQERIRCALPARAPAGSRR